MLEGGKRMSRAAWCGRTARSSSAFRSRGPDWTPSRNPPRRFRASSRTPTEPCCPVSSVIVKNDTTGAAQEVTTDAEGRYQATALGAGLVHRVGDAVRLQDRHREEHPRRARSAGHHSAHARDRPARRDGHRHEQLGADQHRRTATVSATLNSDQLTRHADADPQRAERRHVPARHQHHRHATATRRSTACPRAS